MKKISEWLNKKPATKAGWFAAGSGILTVIIISFQTCLLNKQTNLLDRQTKISEMQTLLLNNQIEASTKPSIDIIIDHQKGFDTVIIHNKGNFAVSYVQIMQVYFAKIVSHGWYTIVQNIPKTLGNLKPKEIINYCIKEDIKLFKDHPVDKSFIIQDFSEYLVLLVSFERSFDGKNYLAILPGRLMRTSNGVERWPDEGTSATGPLGKICNPGIELTLDLLKRKPFLKDYEFYNASYPLNYNRTGCLYPIEWVD